MLSPDCADFQDLGVVYGGVILGECDGVIIVVEGAGHKKGVEESWHDVTISGGIGQELREIEAAASGGWPVVVPT